MYGSDGNDDVFTPSGTTINLDEYTEAELRFFAGTISEANMRLMNTHNNLVRLIHYLVEHTSPDSEFAYDQVQKFVADANQEMAEIVDMLAAVPQPLSKSGLDGIDLSLSADT